MKLDTLVKVFMGVFAISLIIVIINMIINAGIDQKAYQAKCESRGGVVYHPRDELKKCMKKEFFIEMENK